MTVSNNIEVHGQFKKPPWINVEKKMVAAEWDGGWFCDECEKMIHWKEGAYIVGKKLLCETCYIKWFDKVMNKN